MDTNFFCGNTLDRLSEKRNDLGFIKGILRDDLTGFFIYEKSIPLAKENDDGYFELFCLNYKEVLDWIGPFLPSPASSIIDSEESSLLGTSNVVFLGEDKQLNAKIIADPKNASKKYFFALDVSEFAQDFEKIILQKNINAKFLKSRFESFKLREKDAAISALCQSMLDWNRRYKFCATCGGKTKSDDAGFKRTCTDAKCSSNKGVHNTSYPRTDPVVIAAVASPDKSKLLLGRKKQFPENMYSCLAGFMEPGESIEEATQREIKEESGIDVHEVRYVSSQPWPYPSALMIGCIARAINENIVVCTEELEDVKWFEYKEVKLAVQEENIPSGSLLIPPKQTIANRLINHWVKECSNKPESKI